LAMQRKYYSMKVK